MEMILDRHTFIHRHRAQDRKQPQVLPDEGFRVISIRRARAALPDQYYSQYRTPRSCNYLAMLGCAGYLQIIRMLGLLTTTKTVLPTASEHAVDDKRKGAIMSSHQCLLTQGLS